MRKSILWAVAGLLGVMGLFACVDRFTRVNLSVIKNFAEAKTQGSTMSFDMVGSSSRDGNLTGTVSYSIVAPTVMSTSTGTQTVNVINLNSEIKDFKRLIYASRTTYYYYQTGYFYKGEQYDGTISTPVSQTLLPSSARVGDSGADMVIKRSDGSTSITTWRIEPGNGDANFVTVCTHKNKVDAKIGIEEDSFTIKRDGSIAALSLKYYDSRTGDRITMSGKPR